MARILLTGITGTIGKSVGETLYRQGHEIHGICRNSQRARKSIPFPCELIEWDIANPKENSLAAYDFVIHLAGEPIAQRWSAKVKASIESSRVEGTKNLIDALSNEPGVFICSSAIGIYGDRGDEVLDESSTHGDGFLAEVCKKWEGSALTAEEKNWTVHLVRTGIVLDADSGALKQMLTPFELGVGAPVGSGKQYMSWIHIEDISKIFCDLVEQHLQKKSPPKIVNGVAGEPLTNKDFSKVLAKVLRKPLLPNVPGFMLKLMFGEMGQIVLSSARVTSRHKINLDYNDLEKALSDLLAVTASGEKKILVKQFFSKPPDKIFGFFCDENNLEQITPPQLRFKVLGKNTPSLMKDTLIEYRLSLFGIPFKWRTRIAEWKNNLFFADEQLKGPYAKWYHEHHFEKMGSGTQVVDAVTYRVPLGFLGRLVAGYWVGKQVEQIFSFRRQQLHKILEEKTI